MKVRFQRFVGTPLRDFDFSFASIDNFLVPSKYSEGNQGDLELSFRGPKSTLTINVQKCARILLNIWHNNSPRSEILALLERDNQFQFRGLRDLVLSKALRSF